MSRERNRSWLVWSFNVGPELGRETDAIAESAYTIQHRLRVTTHACDIIIRLAGKVVRPKPDQLDWQHRLCSRYVHDSCSMYMTVIAWCELIPPSL